MLHAIETNSCIVTISQQCLHSVYQLNHMLKQPVKYTLQMPIHSFVRSFILVCPHK